MADDREVGSWRDREAAAEPRGVALDPLREPVPGLSAFGTVYVPGHLIISGDPERATSVLRDAGAALGWDVKLETIREATQTDEGGQSSQLTRARIFQSPKPGRDDEPVPPVDAWRLLQRARTPRVDEESAKDVAVEASRSVDPGARKPQGPAALEGGAR